MADVTLHPGRLKGSLAVPPSKSAAHRALILAALSRGESRVFPVEDSQDMAATLGGIRALGASVVREGESVRVMGRMQAPSIWPEIDCFESGSTLRFLLPLSLVLAGGGTFLLRGRLGERPLGPYEALFQEQGIRLTRFPGGLKVEGHLAPGEYKLPGNVSSQFITGLLLALPFLPGNSVIQLTTDPESEGYIDLTLQGMADFGLEARRAGPRLFEVPGNQSCRGRTCRVEGDYSQAAVFLCAGALGSEISLTGLDPASRQGDRMIIPLLQGMGAEIRWEEETLSVSGGALRATRFDGGPCPDILPMMALTACLSRGESRIDNAGRLRLKECDRLAATVEELSRLGADIRAQGDSIMIMGQEALQGGVQVDSHNDHRMAMMLSIAALYCRQPVLLEGSECVAKSWPGYWKDYISLGGRAV